MWWVIDIILMLAPDLCSWRVWLCIGIAVVIVAGLYHLYPEHDGFWSVSYPAAIIVIAMGFWWQYRADRT
jgi:hypothetical protein